MEPITLDDARVTLRTLRRLFVVGYDHASEGMRALEGYVRGAYPDQWETDVWDDPCRRGGDDGCVRLSDGISDGTRAPVPCRRRERC